MGLTMEADPLCTAGPGIHIAECLDCHRVTDVGWAHLCEPCWDTHVEKVWQEKLGTHSDGDVSGGC